MAISAYDVPPVRCSQTSTTGQGAVISMPQMHRLETDVAEDVEGMHTDLANTKSAMSEELSQTHQKWQRNSQKQRTGWVKR